MYPFTLGGITITSHIHVFYFPYWTHPKGFLWECWSERLLIVFVAYVEYKGSIFDVRLSFYGWSVPRWFELLSLLWRAIHALVGLVLLDWTLDPTCIISVGHANYYYLHHRLYKMERTILKALKRWWSEHTAEQLRPEIIPWVLLKCFTLWTLLLAPLHNNLSQCSWCQHVVESFIVLHALFLLMANGVCPMDGLPSGRVSPCICRRVLPTCRSSHMLKPLCYVIC